MIVYIAAVLGGLVVLGLDQYTKYLVSTHFYSLIIYSLTSTIPFSLIVIVIPSFT